MGSVKPAETLPMDEGRKQRITQLAATLAHLEMRHRCSMMQNVANRSHTELVDIAVADALLKAEINDTRLLLAIEQEGRTPTDPTHPNDQEGKPK